MVTVIEPVYVSFFLKQLLVLLLLLTLIFPGWRKGSDLADTDLNGELLLVEDAETDCEPELDAFRTEFLLTLENDEVDRTEGECGILLEPELDLVDGLLRLGLIFWIIDKSTIMNDGVYI